MKTLQAPANCPARRIAGRACFHTASILALSLTFVFAGISDPADSFPTKAPRARLIPYDWSGLYLGAHTGYGWGRGNAGITDIGTSAISNHFGGPIAGIQVGYNTLVTPNILLGVEADGTFPSSVISNSVVATLDSPRTTVTEQLDYVTTLRGRFGIVKGPWLAYVTGGAAFAAGRFSEPIAGGTETRERMRTGWAAGAGVEYAFAQHWNVRLEYLRDGFSRTSLLIPPGSLYSSTMNFQTFRIGLNRKLDNGKDGWPVWPQSFDPESNIWEIHGQTTAILQGYPSFPARYSGPNSLSPDAQFKTTWSNSLFLNAHLWEGGEVYYNPELIQGFGLSGTVGVAGFPNGEAQKSNFPYPHYSMSRLYLKQTFGFGGEQEELASSSSQLGEKVDISRLTLQVGRFAVTDVFDGNSYAKDTRKDFMNWSIWAPGAFDYSADRGGLTYGATAELNQKSWALRGGYFLAVTESNANNFDPRVGERGTYATELELRYQLFSQPGKIRTIGWFNSVYSGSYRETLDNPAFGTDIAQTRRQRVKYGYVVNVEQALSDQLGLFGRWSWNDGKTEIMTFTDIDASLSVGASIKGKAWGRPDDTIGVATAFNGLSRDHRDFLAAGGLGPIVGDGALNYRKEKILESYYAYALNAQWTLTADYQFIADPAYNADRGPVSVFSGRIHGEF